MRVLVLNYEFPPVGGGGGRVAQDICRGLAARGHSIRVLTSLARGLDRTEERDGYAIYRGFSFRRRVDACTVPEMGAFVVFNLLPALRHAIAWKPDVVHVHFAVPTGVVGWWLGLVTGIPYVLTVHLGDVPGGVPDQTDHLFRWIKPLTVPIWRRAAAITAVSDSVRNLALRSYQVPIETVYNGVDLSRCRPSPPAPHDPPTLVFAGRFNPQKNLLFMVEVLGRVADMRWQMHLLGDGSLMGAVKTRVHELGLAERVHFHGWVEPAQVEAIMGQCDLLLLPSLSEGLPVVGATALGHGLAIVGSATGGIIDVVRDGANGFLCPVNDARAFERSLRQALGSAERLQAMKQASRVLAEEFDLQRVVTKYETILQRVAG
jgi:glycosyltransferase involved in cell wall biosynthesis